MHASQWRKKGRQHEADVVWTTAHINFPVTPEPIQIRLSVDDGRSMVITMNYQEAQALGQRLLGYAGRNV